MLKLFNYNTNECDEFLNLLETRANSTDANIIKAVSDIINDVRTNGDKALVSYTEKFDRTIITKDTIELSHEKLLEISKKVPEKLYSIMVKASENIKAFHEKQKRISFIDTEFSGKITGQRIRPLKRAGIYVPGGTAAYPSSVLMNCIPAKVAGVSEIIMVTPPRDEGITPAVAAAAIISGVDRVFLCGGAQAVAALAYGTETIPKVDIIAGPGNIFVATAKRLVFGAVNIDMFAGPSEVLIVADKYANPKYIAADLLSQAEHDALASAVLVTDSFEVAENTSKEIELQLKKLSRNVVAGKSVESFGGAIVCKNIDEAVKIANDLSPEHLELLVREPLLMLSKIDNAGSVFLGEYSPEPLGDYFAGPNHVLPTNKTARFTSPLSVDNFIKKSSFIYYDKDHLQEYCDDITTFALSEGLDAHANAVKIRFPEN